MSINPVVGGVYRSKSGALFTVDRIDEYQGDKSIVFHDDQGGKFNYPPSDFIDRVTEVVGEVKPGQVWKTRCGEVRTVTKVENNRVYWTTEGYNCGFDDPITLFLKQSTLQPEQPAVGSLWKSYNGSQSHFNFRKVDRVEDGTVYYTAYNRDGTKMGYHDFQVPLQMWYSTGELSDTELPVIAVKPGQVWEQGMFRCIATKIEGDCIFYDAYEKDGKREFYSNNSMIYSKPGDRVTGFQVGYRQHGNKIIKVLCDKASYPTREAAALAILKVGEVYRHNEQTVRKVVKVDGDHVHYDVYDNKGTKLNSSDRYCAFVHFRRDKPTVKPGDWYSYCAAVYQVTKVENGRVQYNRYTKDGKLGTSTGDWEIGEFLTCCTHCPDYKLPATVKPDPFAGTPCWYVNPSTLEVRQGVYVCNDEGKYSFKCKLGYWTYVDGSNLYKHKHGVGGHLIFEANKKHRERIAQINKEWQ